METKFKVVTQTPVTELWREDEAIAGSRGRRLSAPEIQNLLQNGRLQFVVVDVGFAPRWIPLNGCFDFWKRELQTRLAAPEAHISLAEFPGGYCYIALEWMGQGEIPVVVCERQH